MATTAQKTDLYTNLTALPPVMNVRPGVIQFLPWSHTQAGAGDANSTVHVWRIQAGMRLYLMQSPIVVSAFGAARVLQFGWEAYVDDQGTTVVADPDGLFAALDVATAVMRFMGEAPTKGVGLDAVWSRLFRGPANLVLTVTGGTWPDLATTAGMLAVSSGGY
jgi:hypothetical protein